MGAVAIITLTGAEILLHIPLAAPWEEMRAVTRILMLMAWVTATVWIPYLVIMDIRKFTRIGLPGAPPFWVRFFPWARLAFGRRGCSHFFEPSSWGRVFPMGMYTACTLDLTQATEFEFLKIIPSYWGWCALVIWGLTFTGALRTVSSLTYCRCHIISLKE
jgi:tellurite resistance protein TehA-like permease